MVLSIHLHLSGVSNAWFSLASKTARAGENLVLRAALSPSHVSVIPNAVDTRCGSAVAVATV